jgi:beta-glucosidase
VEASGNGGSGGSGWIFPRGFRFGTASSATQIEGGCPFTDWADFARVSGRIAGNGSPLTACDSWNRFGEDLALQRSMNLNAYRLSVEWARIEPAPGEIDWKALERYREMLGQLRDTGIEPMLTLHHFSIPLWVRDRGGLTSRDLPERLEAFTRIVVQAVGDLVDTWITVNEPSGLAALSHLIGYWPPQMRSLMSTIQVHHNLLKSHVLMYRAIHEEAEKRGKEARVGIAHHVRRMEPLDPTRLADRVVTSLVRGTLNDSFAHAVCSGRMYGFGDRLLRLVDGFRVSEARGTQDFFGINYYGRDDLVFRWSPVFFRRYLAPGSEVTDLDWPVSPDDLLPVLREWWSRSGGLPIFITENGLSDATDIQRPSFIVRHLASVARAIAEGIDVRGYYHWTLMDNFEWMFGYQSRFGLANVDFATQERTLRPSGRLYGQIAARGGISADDWERHGHPPADARRMGPKGAYWP